MPFFGVNIGSSGLCESEWPANVPRVCNNMQELQAVLRQHCSVRFKQFTSHAEADAFSRRVLTATPRGVNCNTGGRSPMPAERPSPYTTPSRPECQQLRAAIQCGDIDAVSNMLHANPRLLISSGDTPTLLREGPRENALHQAALHNQASICRLLLKVVADVRTFLSLYPDDCGDVATFRARRALDLFLNMPTKASCETPLHMAAKRGYVDTVAVLVDFDACQRDAVNRHGETPAQLVCEQFKGDGDINEARRRILQLLQLPYFVPVVVDVSGCRLAHVAHPCSSQQFQSLIQTTAIPTHGDSDISCAGEGRSDLDVSLCASPAAGSSVVAVSPSVAALCHSAGEVRPIDSSLMSGCGLCARAWAGPMSQQQAEQFYRRWRSLGTNSITVTPTRSQKTTIDSNSIPAITSLDNNDNSSGTFTTATAGSTPVGVAVCLSPLLSPASCRPDPVAKRVRVSDPDKGLERIGRALAAELHVPWSEYWPFLRRHVDLRSAAGLEALERYLCGRSLRLLRVLNGSVDDCVGYGSPSLFKSNGVVDLLNSVSQRLDACLQQPVKLPTGAHEIVDEIDSKTVNNNNTCNFNLSPISALCSELNRMTLAGSTNGQSPIGYTHSNSTSSLSPNHNQFISKSDIARNGVHDSVSSPSPTNTGSRAPPVSSPSPTNTGSRAPPVSSPSPTNTGSRAPPVSPTTLFSRKTDECLSEENDGFFTPTASLSVSPLDVATPPEPPPVFIDGSCLSRVDFDVYRALCHEQCVETGGGDGDGMNKAEKRSADDTTYETVICGLNARQYPSIVQWMSHVENALVGDVLISENGGAGENGPLDAYSATTPSAAARAILLATPSRNRSGSNGLLSPLTSKASSLSRGRFVSASSPGYYRGTTSSRHSSSSPPADPTPSAQQLPNTPLCGSPNLRRSQHINTSGSHN